MESHAVALSPPLFLCCGWLECFWRSRSLRLVVKTAAGEGKKQAEHQNGGGGDEDGLEILTLLLPGGGSGGRAMSWSGRGGRTGRCARPLGGGCGGRHGWRAGRGAGT